jgi:hypothetical protein
MATMAAAAVGSEAAEVGSAVVVAAVVMAARVMAAAAAVAVDYCLAEAIASRRHSRGSGSRSQFVSSRMCTRPLSLHLQPAG